jgi:hypothetical protein
MSLSGSYIANLSGSITGSYTSASWEFVSSEVVEVTQSRNFTSSAEFLPLIKTTLFDVNLMSGVTQSFQVEQLAGNYQWTQLAGVGSLYFVNNDSTSSRVTISSSITGLYILEGKCISTVPQDFIFTKQYNGGTFTIDAISKPSGSNISVNYTYPYGSSVTATVYASQTGSYIFAVSESACVRFSPTASVTQSNNLTQSFTFDHFGKYKYNLCATNVCGVRICKPVQIEIPE